MSNPSPAGPPPIPDFTVVPTSPPPPPVGWLPGQPAPSPAESTPTERWGMGDILLGVAVIMGAVIVATIGGLAILGFDTLDPLADGDLSSSDAVIFLGLTTVAQGLAMGAWPVLVARWKGNGVVEDFRWRFKPIDLLSGFGMAIVLLVAALVMGWTVSTAVGLDLGADESSNTQIITDAADSAALWIILVSAVVLAPIVEELFFRGLCLRAIEKRFGTTAAVFGSTFLFTLPHFANPSLAGTAVLFSVIGTVGLLLALLVVKTGRLGPAVIAHALFNGVGVIGALAGA